MTRTPVARFLLATLILALVAGCATRTRAPVDDRASAVPPPPVSAVLPPPPSASPSTPASPPPPEKDWRPEFYTVKRGDTLYQVALEHGLDYRELAAMNNIDNVNLIRVGQVLRLRAASDVALTGPAAAVDRPPPETRPPEQREPRPLARSNSDNYKSGPKAVKLPFSEAAFAQLSASAARDGAGAAAASAAPREPVNVTPAAGAPMAAATPAAPASVAPSLASVNPGPPSAPPAPAAPPVQTPSAPPAASAGDGGDDRVDWSWPVRGRIISGYSESASLKGIDIGGASGVPILASAPGKVVYAGSGLRGYGKLVIVKHNKTYLSAYAHLDQITVKEGQTVGKGQELGKMGNTDADQVKLHFEIRSLGKPVDPLRYLPKG